MSKNAHVNARSKQLVQTSNRTSAELRGFGVAAIAFAAFACSASAPATALAQQTESRHQAGHRIAIIDVGYIFRNLPAIKMQVSEVEAGLKEYEAELKRKRDALRLAAEQLQSLKFGTRDYDRQEEEVARLESKLKLEKGRTEKELRDAEAKIYYENYRRIAEAVRAIATHNHINMVIRFNREEMNAEDNASVARGVMKNVVYYDDAIDMTDTVLRYLKQQSGTKQIANGGRAASAAKR